MDSSAEDTSIGDTQGNGSSSEHEASSSTRVRGGAVGTALTMLRFVRILVIGALKGAVAFTICMLTLLGVYLVEVEFQTSYYQSMVFHSLTPRLSYFLEEGRSDDSEFPRGGPYDTRLGFTRLPDFLKRLQSRGYEILEQARQSPGLRWFQRAGFFPPYAEEGVRGIHLRDAKGETLYRKRYPSQYYKRFQDIPPLVYQTLLFIEDQWLLREDQPYYNPAIQWKRFGKAVSDLIVSKIFPAHDVHGGSTLATQMEKFRHSPDGITYSPLDKLRQLVSASLRAYLESPLTEEARREICREYINTVPLAALPGYGEINGLANGLQAYFGMDFERVNQLLHEPTRPEAPLTLEQQAEAYRMVLSLFLAHRRPSFYLGKDPEPLERQITRYVRLLYKAEVISHALFRALMGARTVYRSSLSPKSDEISFVERKASTTIRTELLRDLGVGSLYELDRLDLEVDSTIDEATQSAVTRYLLNLRDKEFLAAQGLFGHRLFSEENEIDQVVYSFTLYERTPRGNLLRVQTDSFDQPFNINEGVLLDLGSTSKFRTVVTYLRVIEQLYHHYAALAVVDREVRQGMDPLRVWVGSLLRRDPSLKLEEFLQRALRRAYSGSTGEEFFTAGGIHTFQNFSPKQDFQAFSVAHALRHSVNLPLIRMMRDITEYFTFEDYGVTTASLGQLPRDMREKLVRRFTEREARQQFARYAASFRGMTPSEVLTVLESRTNMSPLRLAAMRRGVFPTESLAEFSAVLVQRYPELEGASRRLTHLYESNGHDLSPIRRANRTGIHPFEFVTGLTLARYPGTDVDGILMRTEPFREEYYAWLHGARPGGQRRALRVILEADAFQHIHRWWQQMGYRNASLVPSLATSLGVSADQPAALAELMGIILNEGVRMPEVKTRRLRFGRGSPYEVALERPEVPGTRVISKEVAVAARGVLFDIVKNGTAIRLKKGFQGERVTHLFGGKTGTGDNRVKVFGPGRVLKSSTVTSRTATFMFVIGEYLFGTITVFVEGPAAEAFEFTSSLPVQILKSMESLLLPLCDQSEQRFRRTKKPHRDEEFFRIS